MRFYERDTVWGGHGCAVDTASSLGEDIPEDIEVLSDQTIVGQWVEGRKQASLHRISFNHTGVLQRGQF